ncbi:cobalamin biosynthesis protein CobQ [Candidatus Gottesmanbacteria bacterium]|nr:cobalamin biosynthesis protein CobQ [Candidatus Gottesmanbacteria bacterium]
MNFKLVICWLYPELMSTYGDRGNIICLQKRCEWRGIETKIISEIQDADLIFGGGAQDRQQEIVMRDLMSKKSVLEKLLNNNIPGLFVCGAPQLLGRPYLDLFDMETVFPKNKSRLIGNLITDKFVGFENHGGRTYLNNIRPFAKVIRGFGNNGEDKTEGAVYKNWIATYSHGPLLPKNPKIADWLIKTALEIKYKKEVQLEPLDDSLENQAHDFILQNR